jgi:FkbM family methyltransferase
MAVMSYAQNHEDVLLHRLFEGCAEGAYIDVGACHPVFHSVTKLFYDRGWHGINIEPLPSLADLLAQDRQRDVNLRMGLSNREGTSKFFECPASVELSTLCEEQAEVLRRSGFEIVEHSIPVTTLARVCERHTSGEIHFLKIDVENHEREVLEGADWGRYRPRVVLVEATRPQTNIPSYEHWEPLLLAADYLFAFFDGLNRYYVRAEDRRLLPLLQVPANVFDEYQIHEYCSQIEDLRRALGASQESVGRTQAALDLTRAGLDEAHDALTETRRAWEESQLALQDLRTRFDAARDRLQSTQTQLELNQAEIAQARALLGSTNARLEATRAQLAPFQELGPIAIGVARTLRRMSLRSPRLASIAKRMIRLAHPRARALAPPG